MKINVIGGNIPKEEIDAYAEYGRKKYSDKIIKEMTVSILKLIVIKKRKQHARIYLHRTRKD